MEMLEFVKLSIITVITIYTLYLTINLKSKSKES
jgi:hypothetical protein